MATSKRRTIPQPSNSYFDETRWDASHALPSITYGKRSKPLPLRGNHFKRPDPYDIPVEEQQPAIKRRRPSRKRYQEPDPDDSPLSEDELDALYGRNASPILSQESQQNAARRIIPGANRQKNGSSVSKNASHVRKRMLEQPSTTQVKPPDATTSSDCTRDRPGAMHLDSRQEGTSPVEKKSRPAPRKLPVNELLLVTEPQTDDDLDRSECDIPIDETSDPINGTSSSPHEVEQSSHSIPRQDTKAPLTSIRKRFKTPKFTHKSIVALRKKHLARIPLPNSWSGQQRLGDGFDACELKIERRPRTTKRRKGPHSLLASFGALQLQAGPLPEIKFEPSSQNLRLEAPLHGDGDQNLELQANMMKDEDRELSATNHKAKRQVSFSDHVLSEAIRANLSSISAPKRAYSISSDSDSDEDIEEEENAFLADADESEHGEYDRSPSIERETEDAEQSSVVGTPVNSPPVRRVARQSSQVFRRQITTPASHGKFPSETDDILDLPQSPIADAGRRPISPNRRGLVEVDEMILDDAARHDRQNDTEAAPEMDIEQHDMLDEPQMQTSDIFPKRAQLGPGTPHSDTPQAHHPRSILRRKTSNYQDENIDPKDTAHNTRRNSIIDLNDHSRYFTAAANTLRQADGASRPRIIKQRTSDRYSRSSYFIHEPEIQVPDSESVVPETSQQHDAEMLDYSNASQMHVLRRNSGAMWISDVGRSRAPRDLKALTRSVSREHGTMSQSARRRPSLAFQSPMKVRVI